MAESMQLQGLMFQMSANTSTATKNVDKLAESLQRLKKASFALTSVSRLARDMKELGEATKNADKLSKVANALKRLKDASISPDLAKGLQELSGACDSLSDSGISKVERLAAAMKDLKSAGGSIRKISDNGQSVASAIGGKNASEGAVDVNPTQYAGTVGGLRGMFSIVLSDAKGFASRLPETLRPALNLTKAGFRSLGNAMISPFRGAVGKITGIFDSFKRIIFYRMIRSIIKLITQAFTEGLKNLYNYSNSIGGLFAERMDMIATSANYVKNSFAAMVSPLINSLAPALDYIADKIVSVMNLINQFFARLTGKDTYTAAKKVQTAYSDAASGTAGAVKSAADKIKSYTNGIDELNIFEPDRSGSSGGGGSGAGGGASAAAMFEEVPIDGAVSSFADQLRDTFANEEWEKMGGILATKLNTAFADPNMWYGTGKSIAKGINAAATVADSFFKGAEFGKVGSAIAGFVNGAIETLEGTTIGSACAGFVVSGFKLIGGFFTDLNYKSVGKVIANFITGALGRFTDWLNTTNWINAGETIVQALVDLAEGLSATDKNGKNLGNALLAFAGAAMNAAGGIITGVVISLKDVVIDSISYRVEKEANWWKDVFILPGKEDLDNYVGDLKTNIINPIVEAFQDGFDMFSIGTSWVAEHIIDPIGSALMGEKWEQYKTSIPIIGEFYKTDPTKLPSTEKALSDITAVLNKTDPTKLPVSEKTIGGLNAGITSITSSVNKNDTKDKTVGGLNGNVTSITSTVKDNKKKNRTIGGVNANIVQMTDNINVKKNPKTISGATAIATKLNTTGIPNEQKTVQVRLKLTAKETNSKYIEQYLPGIKIEQYYAKGGFVGKNRRVPFFASGGMPSAGQMFIAREAGAELVGNIGRNTAVMNNNQIVSSVASGVASAVASVLSKIRLPEQTMSVQFPQMSYDTSAERDYNSFKKALDDWYDEKLRQNMNAIAENSATTARNSGKQQTISVRDITAEQKRQAKANGYAFA